MVLLPASSSATTVRQISFDDLCARADTVFFGTVTAVETRRTPGSDFIYTYTQFDVAEWLTGGDRADSYCLKTLGGTLGEKSLVVHGMPGFEIGRQYILFLHDTAPSVCPVVGWHQGCFHVLADGDNVTPVVHGYDHQPIIDVDNGDVVNDFDSSARTRRPTVMTLDRFISKIKKGIARRADRRNAAGKR